MSRMAAYLARCEAVIARDGWMIQGVFPTESDPGPWFAYTIGLTVAGLPELVIVGTPITVAQSILDEAAKRHLGDELLPGAILDDLVSVPPLIVIDAPTAEVGMARRLYGVRRVSSVQLVWPDDDGAYPWDPSWSLPAEAQPLYGAPPSAECAPITP